MNIRLYKDSDKILWDEYVYKHPDAYHAHLSGWKDVIEKSYKKKSYYLLTEHDEKIVGILPLFHIKSLLFGNQLVSMPYQTYGGVLADNDNIAKALIDESLKISSDLKADLELKHIKPLNENLYDQSKTNIYTEKVSMRLELPATSEYLFNSFKSKMRSQIRRPQKEGMIFKLGGKELIDDFYKVFAINMRDLGSPVHTKKLFVNIFQYLSDISKIGIVYYKNKTVASGLITTFKDFMEIPWASTLRKYNRFSPNMLLYWSFLQYSINNEFKIFDFGRSTPGEGTFRFKEQWDAKPSHLYWYKISRKRNLNIDVSTKKDINQKQLMVFLWKKLPLPFTNLIGPRIRNHISL